MTETGSASPPLHLQLDLEQTQHGRRLFRYTAECAYLLGGQPLNLASHSVIL